MLNVGGEENPRQVVLVGLEGADRDDACDLGVLDHAPDIYVSLGTVSWAV